MTSARHGSGDDSQRARLTHMLRDPAGYYAQARRQAHEYARQVLAENLDRPRPHTAG